MAETAIDYLVRAGQSAPRIEHHHRHRVRHHSARRGSSVVTTGWPLSLIVLIASIMILSGKILALAYLLITAQRSSIQNAEERVRFTG